MVENNETPEKRSIEEQAANIAVTVEKTLTESLKLFLDDITPEIQEFLNDISVKMARETLLYKTLGKEEHLQNIKHLELQSKLFLSNLRLEYEREARKAFEKALKLAIKLLTELLSVILPEILK